LEIWYRVLYSHYCPKQLLRKAGHTMSKSLSVKVKVSSLITALEAALAERDKRFAALEAEEAKHEKAVEVYNLAVLKLIKAGKAEITEASKNSWADRHEKKKGKSAFSVNVLLPTASLPVEPQQPHGYSEHLYKREREEITQAIRVLKMTDQTEVSASTYRSVAEYL